MSYGGPNTQSVLVKAPIKGSFPLDHDGTCRDSVLSYLNCVKRTTKMLHDHPDMTTGESVTHKHICGELMRQYFECRMRNGLMEREEWDQLGMT